MINLTLRKHLPRDLGLNMPGERFGAQIRLVRGGIDSVVPSMVVLTRDLGHHMAVSWPPSDQA